MRFSVWHLVLVLSIALLSSRCSSSKGFVRDHDRLSRVQRIGVLPFDGADMQTGETVSEAMLASLLTSRFTVIERGQLEKLLHERGLTVQQIVKTPSQMVGKINGVDALIIGSLTVDRGWAGLFYGGSKDYISSATARMIDVRDGTVLSAATFSSSGPSTMSGVVTPADVGEQLAEELQNE